MDGITTDRSLVRWGLKTCVLLSLLLRMNWVALGKSLSLSRHHSSWLNNEGSELVLPTVLPSPHQLKALSAVLQVSHKINRFKTTRVVSKAGP